MAVDRQRRRTGAIEVDNNIRKEDSAMRATMRQIERDEQKGDEQKDDKRE